MMKPDMPAILQNWVRLGVLLDARPARQTPDIEKLLVQTAEAMPGHARLLGVLVSWAVAFERLICRHRLAAMAAHIAEDIASAALGFALTEARRHTVTDHLSLAIAACRSARPGGPLFDVDRPRPLAELARQEACPESHCWGVWSEQPRVRTDIIRSSEWILNQNPTLQARAVFGGNLRASVLECLRWQPEAGRSESNLARACGATRKALREALDHLEFCGLIARIRADNSIRVQPGPRRLVG